MDGTDPNRDANRFEGRAGQAGTNRDEGKYRFNTYRSFLRLWCAAQVYACPCL